MIRVKAAKSTTDFADVTDPYAPQPKTERQGLPFVIGTAIVSIALYFKSMVTTVAAPLPHNSPKSASGELPLLSSGPDSDSDTGESKAGAEANNGSATPAPTDAAAEDATHRTPHSGLALKMRSNVVPFVPPTHLPTEFTRPLVTKIAAAVDLDTGMDQLRFPLAVGGQTPEPVPDQTSEKGAETLPSPNRNRAPVVSRSVYLSDILAGETILVSLASLLAFATDADADILQVDNLSVSSGRLEPAAGGMLYTPDSEITGPVQITYTVTDGEFHVKQTAHLGVLPRPLSGTESADDLRGTAFSDAIAAMDGDDSIDAGNGDDIVYGGAGNDLIIGGAGNDALFGGQGNDTVFGEGGNDLLHGNEGNDRLYGGAGDDVLSGDAGDDQLDAGEGNDLLLGGDGHDSLVGGTGDDVLFGGSGEDHLDGNAGNDQLHGGAGNDVLIDSAGSDTLWGDGGSDLVIAALDASDDSFNGDGEKPANPKNTSDDDAPFGPDHPAPGAEFAAIQCEAVDVLDYSAAEKSLEINLAAGFVRGEEVGTDRVQGFEVVLAGKGDDHFVFGEENCVVGGGEGDDQFDFSNTPLGASGVVSAYQILDFNPGDVVETRKYKLFEREDEHDQPCLDDDDTPAYGAQTLANIRIRYEIEDERDHTIIEMDDDDSQLVAVVTVNGHHLMFFSEVH